MMTKSKKSYRRYNLLLQDSQVKAWYDEVGLGLESTAKNYLRMIGIFAERSGYPDEARGGRPRGGVTLLRNYIQANRDENGESPASRVVKKAVISWAKFIGIETDKLRDVSVKGSLARREFTDLPTRAQLRATTCKSPNAAIAFLPDDFVFSINV